MEAGAFFRISGFKFRVSVVELRVSCFGFGYDGWGVGGGVWGVTSLADGLEVEAGAFLKQYLSDGVARGLAAGGLS